MLNSNSKHNCHHQLYTLALVLPILSVADACTKSDSDSLLGILSNISSAATPPLNWNFTGSECCNWEGITCENGFVTKLQLPQRGLKGQISPSLALLTHLTQLNLSHNFISGNLPVGIFDFLNRLQILDLGFNSLAGKFPFSNNLTSLQIVDISSNFFSGEFPDFGSSPNLTSVNASNNSFFGPIPSSSICISSSLITLLDFSINKFSGQIPDGFGRCSKLEIFRAGFNNISGNLPDDLYNAISLKDISLPFNKLTGIISTSILNLSNLTVIELYGNNFIGELPLSMGSLSNLEQLLLYNNNFTGSLPLSLSDCEKLRILNLRNNLFYGEISINFTRFLQLTALDLGNNNFSGYIPASLYSCRSLRAIRLAKNNLQGQIVSDIRALQSLSYLSLSGNRLVNLTGALQVLVGCKNLTALILYGNFYRESIPDTIDGGGGESFQNLRLLGLGGCQLTGQMPNWLRDCKNLEALDLSLNQLGGSIPGWLGTQSNLFYIDLSGNLLSGTFPVEITDLPTLVSEKMDAQVDQSYLELPVFVKPSNSSSLMYNQLSDLPPAIYVGKNRLEGEIPAEIGKLQVLHVLDLSHNNFSGEIPYQLSNLTNLERLDLSGNNFSGTIPSSLKRLNFLSTFSVADNDLQGPIPTGGQFDTFPRSSFAGNPGLCGWILLNPCNRAAIAPVSPLVSKSRNLKKKVVIGAIIGVCFGIVLLIVITLCVVTSRRIDPRVESDDNKIDLSCNSNGMIPPIDIIANSSLIMLFPAHHELNNLTISDILKATGNFDQANIIGCGGFGLVYKANLANGTKLAVKRLSGDLCLMEREFKAEVEALSSAQHKNLVSLRGYCVHGSFRLLLYSYMENGSLDYWLHERIDGGSKLDWPTRLKIAQGTSRGVAYMHQICEPHIVHRDIKSSNILLDEDFEAHVADFGLSRLILPCNTHVTTELVGTLGYIPPEYGQAWVATLRGDVYSFGVVMLELLTGKRPVEVFKPKASRELVGWVQQMRFQGKQDDVFDPLLTDKGFEEEMLQVLDVACMCVNQNPFKRPTIQEVLHWLHNVGASKTFVDSPTPK